MSTATNARPAADRHSADLRDLYSRVPLVRGCRTCGLAGWDAELEAR